MKKEEKLILSAPLAENGMPTAPFSVNCPQCSWYMVQQIQCNETEEYYEYSYFYECPQCHHIID